MNETKNIKLECLKYNDTGIYDKFFIELKQKFDITLEQFIAFDFQKCGKLKWNYELERYILDPFFKLYFNDKQIINLVSRIKEIECKVKHCICNVRIIHIPLLYSKSQDILLPIGKCCNDSYNPNGAKKFCSLCNVEHKNRKDNICKKCRNENKPILYKKCKKCGIKKEKNIYIWCLECLKENQNKKLFHVCNLCNNTKKEDTFKNCYTCNEKIKNIRNK